MDLLVSRFNCKLNRVVSWTGDPHIHAVDSLVTLWDCFFSDLCIPFAFPSLQLLPRLLCRVRLRAFKCVFSPAWSRTWYTHPKSFGRWAQICYCRFRSFILLFMVMGLDNIAVETWGIEMLLTVILTLLRARKYFQGTFCFISYPISFIGKKILYSVSQISLHMQPSLSPWEVHLFLSVLQTSPFWTIPRDSLVIQGCLSVAITSARKIPWSWLCFPTKNHSWFFIRIMLYWGLCSLSYRRWFLPAKSGLCVAIFLS